MDVSYKQRCRFKGYGNTRDTFAYDNKEKNVISGQLTMKESLEKRRLKDIPNNVGQKET